MNERGEGSEWVLPAFLYSDIPAFSTSVPLLQKQEKEAPKGFDGTCYPWEDERIPKRLAIIKTNQRMVDTCDFLIAYAWHFLGGSGQIVEYARKREAKRVIHVTNLAEKPGSI